MMAMVKRRKGPPARSNAAQRNPERAQVVTESRPPETVSEPETEVTAPAGASPPAETSAAMTTDIHTPSVHDVLLETVSADALGAGTGQPEGDSVARHPPVEEQHAEEKHAEEKHAESAESPEAATSTADEAEPAPVMQPPEALDAAPEPVRARDVEPEAVAAVEIASESAASPVARTPEAILRPTVVSFDVIGEITEANATILAFLRSEGSAAMAHWQSLSGARTPADAIRIQVDEMQRAADASLTCFNMLARRAGRLAAGISRA
ncbi:hypothetical protein [Methylobacterium sp. J-090]|uniref:hypothetical protein n=1 Tax=Methylobacterium sp. J-090 TaxID=2836666 RepID=UPI001FBB4C10|nr:hypothetical protein [Methylobacterium sp. J-090]MCJ2083137.1 hypothetical protein [Methylobacterium sp. J-090]